MGKNKLQHFEENKTFPNFFQPEYREFKEGYFLKGRWASEVFGNDNPIVLELGCGKGEYTVGLAQKYPGRNYLGIDRKGARMWRGAKTSQEKQILNAAFLRIRIEQLPFCFDKNEVSEIWITFPDPHQKNRRSRKRLTSPRFLKVYKDILVDGGILHLKTDSLDFYNFSLEELEKSKAGIVYSTTDLYQSGYTGDAAKIQTFYEKKFLEEGVKIKYLSCKFEEEKESMDEGSFFRKVYQVVNMIPYGRVTSYGAIANYLGSRKSARMVGWAMNASHSASNSVPAHRVVNRIGVLTGKHHFGSPDLMRQLLESEGVIVKDDQVFDFEKHFWDPSRELT